MKIKLKKCSIFTVFVHLTVVSYLGSPEYFLLRKFSVFKRFVYETLVSPSGISVESYMLYYPLNGSFVQLGVIARTRNNFVEIKAVTEGYLIITHVKNKESKKQPFRISLPVIMEEHQ